MNKTGGKDALDDSVFDNDQDSSVVLKQAPKSSPRLKVKSKSTEALFSSRISSNDTGYDSKMASTSGLNDSKNSKKSRGVIENIKMFVGRRSKNSTNSSTLPRPNTRKSAPSSPAVGRRSLPSATDVLVNNTLPSHDPISRQPAISPVSPDISYSPLKQGGHLATSTPNDRRFKVFQRRPKLSIQPSPLPEDVETGPVNALHNESSIESNTSLDLTRTRCSPLASYARGSTQESTFEEPSSGPAQPKPIARGRAQNKKDAFRRQTSVFLSMLVDWEVPHEDLVFEKELPGGRFGTKCYVGKWHGECNIRKVEVSTRNKQRYMQYMRAFKQELMNYKKTRHDNVELFLGACLTYPNLAIVTRNYRGWRLDTHMRDSSPSLDHARMIAEHICQGLGYLHSRRIVHRDLRPANVMFDQAGKAVIKGLGLSTLAAFTGVGSLEYDSLNNRHSITLPTDWVHRLAPELCHGVADELKPDSSIIPKLKYTNESDIYAFGVLWAELMATVHPGSVSTMIKRKEDIKINLNQPPSDGFEGKLYEAGLGNKPTVPDVLQDHARTIVYRCCNRDVSDRPNTKSLSSLLSKVQSQNKLTRRWTDRYK